jgi:hypothetical protein
MIFIESEIDPSAGYALMGMLRKCGGLVNYL